MKRPSQLHSSLQLPYPWILQSNPSSSKSMCRRTVPYVSGAHNTYPGCAVGTRCVRHAYEKRVLQLLKVSSTGPCTRSPPLATFSA